MTRQPELPFIDYPTNQIFAVLEQPEELEGALGSLETANLTAEVFSGDEGVRRVDASGHAHGFRGRLVRTFQLLGDEAEHARRYQRQLEAGHFVVSVEVTPEQKKSVADLLRTHGGHFINYYGPWAVENL